MPAGCELAQLDGVLFRGLTICSHLRDYTIEGSAVEAAAVA